MITVTAILLAMTAVSGVVDAVSFIALGHVFTANMTGNIVFLGFAIGGVAGLSMWRSLLALAFFMSGAVLGGWMTRIMKPENPGVTPVHALAVETILLWVASAVSIGFRAPYEDNKLKIALGIALTAVAMGLRNAVVRKLGVPDLTTTVLTLTIVGFAADSSLSGGNNPRWGRRAAAVLAMLTGAIAGASMLTYSVAVPLFVCGVVTAICALAQLHLSRRELSNG
ncbi:MAG TPA: YoaK family protein [Bryobacteraceae bacterium]|nr:YoaK family protein [Bryobacteraceae bacterium]